MVRTALEGAPRVSAIRSTDEYARQTPLGSIDLQPGERRGFWKYYAPGKWYKQAKIHGKLNNREAVMPLDTGAEVFILDTTFAREVGCQIDTSVTQECVGIRDETYFTVGKTRVKVTLAGNMVYYMDLWVGDLVGQNAIFGMNFMVPAGVRIDTADGTSCLPDEVRIQMIGRRPLYGSRMRPVTIPSLIRVAAGQTYDVPLRPEKGTQDALYPKIEHETRLGAEPEHGPHLNMGSTEEPEPSFKEIPEYEYADEEIEDLKIGRPEGVDPEEAAEMEERLRQVVWKKRKWLVGKGNALPPAANGVICDIDVGNARPVAQRVRKISSQFREKLAGLIRGLLSARMIRALVNGLTQLMVYPMPLVTDLLDDMDKYRWYCSLDMASGFWVVPMTDRARLIFAFITPFGLFEWLRMSFGLGNAPQIYLRLIDNALYGFWKLSPTDDTRDVFKDGSWDDLCEKVERLLDVCEEWHLSISVEKSEWGMPRVDYLGHEISENGLGVKPKNLGALAALNFPRTQKGLQSYLGSLNYYHHFISDFAIFATALYSLSARDFEERTMNPETRDVEKWDHAERAFTTLRNKIAATPMLKHFDADRQPVVIVYASDWASSAVLTQEHDGVYMPAKFTSRTLKPNELNYNITEMEILALLRVLNECHNMRV
ncbi:Eukaryotic/viral aspartic protease [Phytophthora megakarya]|uniref:Eukaryotic/viral aspartic protease n=1 Tax=Phytophthora megakarya TaxID=4795 RepID=A0A225VUI6_9STRA|nr:Eukaryotic/viral aspartic protease [Phytophthora megakarya]